LNDLKLSFRNPVTLQPVTHARSQAIGLFLLGAALTTAEPDPKSLIYSGNYQNGQFESLTFVNSVVGWDLFFDSGFRGGSTTIANVEAGQVWTGHEAFVRPPGSPNSFFTYTNLAPGSLNELDYHATTVGHVLVGSGYVDNGGSGAFTYAGLGMAPEAKLITAGVAVEFSATDPGSFSTTGSSVITAYKSMFQGTGLGPGVPRPEVINSSWGGGDPSATSNESLAIDGLARQNAAIAFVVSAGNGGSSAVVSSPAAGYNNISVGSLGGSSFLTPSDFSSGGKADFYNPQDNGGTTYTGVRAAVDIAAPGERLFLAAYFGDSGTIGNSPALSGLVRTPSPADQYFLNLDGTSYSAPIVAGGIALLKDVAKTDLFFNHNGNPDAFDTRVVKSVLMAGADKTEGWNNGQNSSNVTSQALDLKTGAGAMNLETSAEVYFFGTRDLAGNSGGSIGTAGWDYGTITLGTNMEYVFSSPFTQEMTLNVALNWFSVTTFNPNTDVGTNVAFSDLNLQVWQLDGLGQFTNKVGESMSLYNNTEFLRFDSLAAGQYGLRVTYDGKIFDTSNAVNSEAFGLAWRAVAVPEPSGIVILLGAVLVSLRRRRAV
jgi:hypothetical protein